MKALLTVLSRDERLQPHNLNTPDCLLPAANEPILQLNIKRLEAAGIDVVVLAGKDAEAITSLMYNVEASLQIADSGVSLAESVVRALPDEGRVLLASASTLLDPADLAQLPDADSIVQDHSVAGSTSQQPACAVASVETLSQALSHPDNQSAQSIDQLLTLIAEHVGSSVEGHSQCLIFPWNLIEHSVAELHRLTESDIKGDVSPLSEVNGPIVLGEGSVIRAGCTIDGPVVIGKDCTIGPGAYIRPDTVIGDNCALGNGVELYDTVILSGTTCKHRSYIGHSVIGSNVNIGAGLITSDYRHDGEAHTTRIQGVRMNSGRRKLGAFIGDDVKTGIHTSVYPGRKLWPETTTRPGEIVDEDRD